MYISKKKLKALVDESMNLQKQNRKLRRELDMCKAENERLSDSNLDLWFEIKLLNAKLQRKEGQGFGEYFYKTSEVESR